MAAYFGNGRQGEVLDAHGDTEDKTARLQVRLAEAHLRLADANVYDAVLAEMAQIVLAKNPDGSARKVAWRTRVRAATVLLRSASEAAKSAEKGPSVAVQVNNQVRVTIDRDEALWRRGDVG
jgi:hypothetical protein